MMDKTKVSWLPLSLCLLTASLTAHADLVPYKPRLTASGDINDTGYGRADAMIPVVGENNQFIYADVAGKYAGNDGWMISPGIGTRTIIASKAIFGAYVFADDNNTSNDATFWIANPGLELITKGWDAHINGYFPVSDDKRRIRTDVGTGPGMRDFVQFRDHTEFAPVFKVYEEVGRGADASIGKTFSQFKDTRVYLGGYTFDYRHNDKMNGGQVGINVPVNNYISVRVDDSYDNVFHNEANVGIELTLGGVPQPQKLTLRDHMLDPIQRHLGTIDSGSGTVARKFYRQDMSQVVRNNIWFFNPAGGATYNSALGFDNCTFGSPCSGVSYSQSTLDSINTLAPGANLYVNSGTINFAGNQNINLPVGMNVFGRTNTFATQASGSNRPLFNGSYTLLGNNSINDIQVHATMATPGLGSAVTPFFVPASATTPVSLNHVNGIATSSTASTYGVTQASDSTLSINNSTFTSTTSGFDDFALGVQNISSGTLVMNNSTFNVSVQNDGTVEGVNLDGAVTANITNSTFNLNNPFGSTAAGESSALGFLLSSGANLNLTNANVNISNFGGTQNTSGIKAVNNSTATVNSSTFNINGGQPNISATNTQAGSAVTFNDSTLVMNGPGASLDLDAASTLTDTTATCNGVACS